MNQMYLFRPFIEYCKCKPSSTAIDCWKNCIGCIGSLLTNQKGDELGLAWQGRRKRYTAAGNEDVGRLGGDDKVSGNGRQLLQVLKAKGRPELELHLLRDCTFIMKRRKYVPIVLTVSVLRLSHIWQCYTDLREILIC